MAGGSTSSPFLTSPSGRLCWTNDLHKVFLQAVKSLGPTATPTAIQKQMNIQGLSRQQVSSHWQHFRKRGYPQPSSYPIENKTIIKKQSSKSKDKGVKVMSSTSCPEEAMPQDVSFSIEISSSSSSSSSSSPSSSCTSPAISPSNSQEAQMSTFWLSPFSTGSLNLSSSTDSSPSSCYSEQYDSTAVQIYSNFPSSSFSFTLPEQQQQHQQHQHHQQHQQHQVYQLHTQPGFYSQDYSHSVEVSLVPESKESLSFKCSLEDTEITLSDSQLHCSIVYSVCGSSWADAQSTFCPVETSFHSQS